MQEASQVLQLTVMFSLGNPCTEKLSAYTVQHQNHSVACGFAVLWLSAAHWRTVIHSELATREQMSGCIRRRRCMFDIISSESWAEQYKQSANPTCVLTERPSRQLNISGYLQLRVDRLGCVLAPEPINGCQNWRSWGSWLAHWCELRVIAVPANITAVPANITRFIWKPSMLNLEHCRTKTFWQPELHLWFVVCSCCSLKNQHFP